MIDEYKISCAVEDFYTIVQHDILIGYHFRNIEDFDTHIPRIINFWILQLNGTLKQKSDLPYKLLEVHKALPIKKAEINRWVILFEQSLNKFLNKNEVDQWLEKVQQMKMKIIQHR